MRLHKLLDLGPFGVNSYVIESKNKSAVIIDAPRDSGSISGLIDSLGLSPKLLLLTHGHIDHIESAADLAEKYGLDVMISGSDADMLKSPALCLADYFSYPFKPFYGAKEFSGEDTVALDDITLRIVETPGHSPGSVCFISEDFILTGDTLFAGSVGRTDLGGDYNVMMRSISRLYELGRNYIIYPGHGPASDLYTELESNPYLEIIRGK